MDHYENPRNVGSLDKNNKNVGTGLVGAPACGDVMKLQVRDVSVLFLLSFSLIWDQQHMMVVLTGIVMSLINVIWLVIAGPQHKQGEG